MLMVQYNYLKELEQKEKEKTEKLRGKLAGLPHKIKGNFIALFGRQFDGKRKLFRCLKPMWGGFYIKYNELEMAVDPGINVLNRAFDLGVNLVKTNTLFVSHAHIDHKNDTNVVMEMASYQREREKTNLLISRKSLKDKAVSDFHAGLGKGAMVNVFINYLDKEKTITLFKNIKIKPIKVVHSIGGAYGFVLNFGKLKVGYTGDSGFCKTFKTTEGEYKVGDADFKGEIIGAGIFNKKLRDVFADTDILIFNLHSVAFRKNSLYHSTVSDIINILKGSRIKFCIIDHFNPCGSLGIQFPKLVEQYIKQETKKKIQMVGLNGLVHQI